MTDHALRCDDLAVNDIFLRTGRLPEPSRTHEALVSADFADAHGFVVGSHFDAIIGGAKIPLTVVGIGLSPEYIYALGPGDART